MAEKYCDQLNINTTGCASGGKPTRNNYFTGKLIGADDLTLEQAYVNDKMRRMNSETAGCGVIRGLTVAKFSNSDLTITLNAGAGIDGCGNLLILREQTTFRLPETLDEGDYVYLKYRERGDEKVGIVDEASCSEECCYNRIVEDMEVHVDRSLLVSGPETICAETRSPLRRAGTAGVRETLKARSTAPLLLIGRYTRGFGKRWNVDVSQRPQLHTNAELSELLCRIEQNHVSSLNGRHGDLTAVTTVNNALPDASGALSIVAGNNITVASEGNTITISARSGFHAEYAFSLEAGKSREITHNSGHFPAVDVYRRVRSNSKVAVLESELLKVAADLNVEKGTYLKAMETEPLALHLEATTESFNRKSRKNIINTLKDVQVQDYSKGVLDILDRPLAAHLDAIVLQPLYSYEKIVGQSDPAMKIEVRHTGNSTVRITNQGSTSINLFVILNT